MSPRTIVAVFVYSTVTNIILPGQRLHFAQTLQLLIMDTHTVVNQQPQPICHCLSLRSSLNYIGAQRKKNK